MLLKHLICILFVGKPNEIFVRDPNAQKILENYEITIHVLRTHIVACFFHAGTVETQKPRNMHTMIEV
jgi:hypothetical protein